MTAHFAKTSGKKLGYNPSEVDDLIAKARETFSSGSGDTDSHMVRHAQFSLVKGGYEIAQVDAALDRLDDAFALQRAKASITKLGAASAQAAFVELKQTLSARTTRKAKRAFSSSGIFTRGYQRKQVDALLKQVDGHFKDGIKLTVEQLRQARFKPVTRGYKEAQVDAFIDRAIDALVFEQALA